MASSTKPAPKDRRLAIVALGVLVFAALRFVPAPAGVGEPAWAAAALCVLMITWWITEALPLAATALLPLVLVPALGLGPIESVATAYAHPLIFLFLGGFFFAQSFQHWGVHQRIAQKVMAFSHSSLSGLIGSLMAVTAFLSLWISNTATAMLMIPIAQSLSITFARAGSRRQSARGDRTGTLLVLSVAFSATIGGMGSLIGTPPNALLAAYLQSAHGIHISFGAWMLLGLPVATILLVLAWFLFTRILYRSECLEPLPNHPPHAQKPKPLSPAGRRVALIGLVTGAALLSHPLVRWIWPNLLTHDSVIVLTGALLLFMLPAGTADSARLLHWEQARRIRWDVLILFGGGLALAQTISGSELANVVGQWFQMTSDWPPLAAIALVMFIVVLMGELASNTAIAAIVLPIAGAAAMSQQVPVISIVLPVGLVASLGFMLPVATPPNAIAYGTGAVTMRQMIVAGGLLDLLSVPIVWMLVVTVGYWLFMN